MIKKSINSGYPVIVSISVDKDSPFGYNSNAHYVVIFDAYIDDNGKRRVNVSDPFNSSYTEGGSSIHKDGQKIQNLDFDEYIYSHQINHYTVLNIEN